MFLEILELTILDADNGLSRYIATLSGRIIVSKKQGNLLADHIFGFSNHWLNAKYDLLRQFTWPLRNKKKQIKPVNWCQSN